MKVASSAGLLAAAVLLVLLLAAPCVAAEAGPCTVTGTLLDFAGAPVPRVWVEILTSEDGVETLVGADLTAEDGSFVVAGVPETTSGEVRASVGAETYRSVGHAFTAAGPNAVVLRPGRLDVTLDLQGDRRWRPPFLVESWGARGGARTWVHGRRGTAAALAPDCTYAVAYPYSNQAIEWFGPAIAVTPGVRAGSIAFNRAQARSAWFAAPRWRSGAPGATTSVVFANWPAGYAVGFAGTEIAPDGRTRRWPSISTSGRATFTRSFHIPSTATPGYTYEVHILRTDPGSRLDLTLHFQVATLAATPRAIVEGESVRLSGVVPTRGHWGSKPGEEKVVTLYARTSRAGQPTSWDATRSGWTRIGAYRTDGYGVYQTARLRPKRTTWYVVRYSGDDTYFRAYSSVVRVAVE